MSKGLIWKTLAFSLCIVTSMALAQNQPMPSASGSSGTFSGRLSGAGMDDATITLTNSATGATQTATTDGSGSFTFSNLTPGMYQVAVRLKSGLQMGQSSIEIATSGSNQIQVQLKSSTALASAGGSMELEGKAYTLNLNSAEVARSYETQFVRSLPILDRQNQELITLMPGITPPVVATSRINDPQRTRSFNVNGQPSYTNLFNQDGAYDNEPFSGRPLRVAPDESVEALEVRTSNYNAEYGIAAGSWASTLTRPGTNAIHGSLFEFNTNNYFSTGRSIPQSPSNDTFTTNQFGGTLGGALIHNRVFGFLSYEGHIQHGYQNALATVPTAAFAAGNFGQLTGGTIFNPSSGNALGNGRTMFGGNMIPPSQINPVSRQILGALPAPNLAGFSNNLVGNVRLLDDNHRMDGKLDHRFSEKSTGFFRYGFTEASVNQGSLLGVVGSPLDAEFRAMNAVASLTQIFSKNLLAEFRVGYDRYRNQVSPWADAFSNRSLSLTGFQNGVPSVNIAGFTPFGMDPNVPRKEIDNVFDGAINLLFHTGMHSLKFGIGGRELQSNGFSNSYFSNRGSFQFGSGSTLGSANSGANLNFGLLQANALAGFLVGAPTQAGVFNYTLTPAYRQRQYSAYLTDTINLFQHLYLELGVRYDLYTPVEAARPGGAVVFDPNTNTLATLGMNGVGLRSAVTDTNNIAPRVGLSFRPISRLVFRAGYGIHYFPVPFGMYPFNPAAQGAQSGLAGGLATTRFTTPTVSAAGTLAPNIPFIVGPRSFATPYIQTLSAMIQGDLGNGFLLDVGYVGNAGRQLPFNVMSSGLPGSGLTGQSFGRTASLTRFDTGVNSNYHSGQVNLTKRFAAGLAMAGAYTYSKALDLGTNLANPFDRASNYGVADWDRTHILSMSHNWRLPFGAGSSYFNSGWGSQVFGSWEINGILRWATGSPYTVTVDPLACNCPGVGSLPAAFNSSAAGSNFSLNGMASFDPSLFTAPAPGTFGALRRNSFRGPDLFVYNMALFRNFPIRENVKIEFRGEVYNLTNTTNLTNPVANASMAGFGASTGSLSGAAGRQFQVGARILF